ncbi:hairy/enhancer-of-split related with YRPW motif protein-like [Pollicipes pollicipes]|uniref:hairy/enhancer-of-split related with YRPW motif protein-like n=1 Tax=Pollicipes pollicipes TaxID=41117 RepID=UPI0018856C5E|nr:hairy/enhancer-of-split related with YRPW motif protein-like [Pollicipes pollicipes]
MSGMKRALSDSECDDAFAEDGKEESSPHRKRRRGVIEKRRRDRINSSLAELRRLVPSAFEKQGSAKLEKAEILQLTVDHLRVLHAKGLDALAYDPNKFAMDYHSIGFRECTAEVARYLVTVEGMDIQDPLRLRLMSHLQCYSAQRELANKQHSSGWGLQSYPSGASLSAAVDQGYHAALAGHGASTLATHEPAPANHMARYNPPAAVGGVMTQYPANGGFPGAAQPMTSYAMGVPSQQHVGQASAGSAKPYRPWGTELAY